MAAIAAPATRAMAAPTQAFPDQMQAPAPERAPMSMMPSIPRFSTPARSVISSPRQAKRIAVPAATAAASTETMNVGVRISVMARWRDGETARRQEESQVVSRESDGKAARRGVGAPPAIPRQHAGSRKARSQAHYHPIPSPITLVIRYRV